MTNIILRIANTGRRRFLLLFNIEDVKRFVENYSPNKSFFIGDLSTLSEAALSSLLKFLEEGVSGTLECYASRDNIKPVLLSRFTQIIKGPKPKPGSDQFKDFLFHTQGEQPTSEGFYLTCPQDLDIKAKYDKMPRGLRKRALDIL
jgi:hypothetical protein